MVGGDTVPLNLQASTMPDLRADVLASRHRPVSVVLAFASEVLCRGLRSMLEPIAVVASVTECSDPAELGLLFLPHGDSRVVICSPVVLTGWCQRRPAEMAQGVRFLVLVPDASDETIAQVTALPADGYILEPGLTPELLAVALTRLLDGKIPMPEAIVRGLLMVHREAKDGPAKRPFALTPREAQVLSLMVDGLSNKEIAVRLRVSVNAAKRHVANVLAKLNCRNRTHAVAMVLREDILRDHKFAGAIPLNRRIP